MNNKGLLIVVSAPSGGGKDTVIKKLLDENQFIKKSISATTRNIREGEEDGVDYFFWSRDKFMEKAENGDMIEWTEYIGNLYGTPKEETEELIKKGYDVILKIEVNGAINVKKSFKDSLSIFVLPPSFEVLEERLRLRGTENEEELVRRLERAKEEVLYKNEYDYVVINDEVERTVEEIKNIIIKEKERRGI